MLSVLSVFYGAHMAAFLYLVAFFTARGILGSGAIPFYVLIGKYFVYWQLTVFGFKYLSGLFVVVGFTGAIYLSLPILYWVNKKFFSGTI